MASERPQDESRRDLRGVGGSRAARRVRPRAEDDDAWLPLVASGQEEEGQAAVSSSSPLAMEATPPRLGLAFILNDEAPHRDSLTPLSAVASRTTQLPLHRTGQWGSPSSYVEPGTSRMWGERSSPTRLASQVWHAEGKSHDGAWGTTSLASQRDTAIFEEKADDPLDYEDKEACLGGDEGLKKEEADTEEEEKADAQPTPHTTVPTTGTLSREEKRRGRTCRVDSCDNYIVHKGLCCRHGGARKCSTEGCESTAKYMGLCWKHGGSTWCKIEGCSKRAKAKGRCWAHGGGTQCGHETCTKVAVSNGLCWAHGGGKRCLFDGCNRPGYERTNGFCDRHFEEMQGVNYFEV